MEEVEPGVDGESCSLQVFNVEGTIVCDILYAF